MDVVMNTLRELTENEKEKLLGFFARGDYVIGMGNGEFDVVSAASVGYGLCAKYGECAGVSLRRFLCENGHPKETAALLKALIVKYRKLYGEKLYDGSDRSRSFFECEAIINDVIGSGVPLSANMHCLDEPEVAYIKERFDDIKSDLGCERFPDAISGCRSALESTLKFANKELGRVCNSKRANPEELFHDFQELSNVVCGKGCSDYVNDITSALRRIVKAISEFRNEFGSSHGTESRPLLVPEEEARLCVNATITICEYVLLKLKARRLDVRDK